MVLHSLYNNTKKIRDIISFLNGVNKLTKKQKLFKKKKIMTYIATNIFGKTSRKIRFFVIFHKMKMVFIKLFTFYDVYAHYFLCTSYKIFTNKFFVYIFS